MGIDGQSSSEVAGDYGNNGHPFRVGSLPGDFSDSPPDIPETEDEIDEEFSLDRFLYTRDHNFFTSSIVEAKEACFDLINSSKNANFWWDLLQDVEAEIEYNDEGSWDEIMRTIYPLIHDILKSRHQGIAFIRDDEVKIAEFIHRYAIDSFLESSRDEAERSERMENLLGTTQSIFLEGHQHASQLQDNQAFVDYQTGYESYLSVLAACKNPEEIKNSALALFEVSSGVDWEAEKTGQSIIGSMAQYRMEKGDYLYDDEYQSTNAYTETAQIALAALIESGIVLNDKETEFLVKKIIDSTEKQYLPHIAEIISKNPDPAIRVLFGILQNQKSHEVERHIALSVLYRIELGRIGISEDGIEYLTRKFDLGEYNNPDYSVQRITSDGKLGVFGDRNELLGFVQLEQADFSGDNNPISKKLREITIDILFTPQVDETPQERQYKLRLVEEFKQNYVSTYRELFPEGNGQVPFHFNNLSLPEQGFVLKFLNNHSEGDPLRKKFFSFIDKFGEDGLKAFRSIEFNPEAGNRLIAMAEKTDIMEMTRLLREYSATYQLADAVAKHIGLMLQNQANDLEINLIRENVLKVAQKSLINFKSDEDSFDDVESLTGINNELNIILNLPPTKEGFIDGQVFLNYYLKDNIQPDAGRADYLVADIINGHLRRLYNDESFDLRDYEGKTTDTAQSLDHLLKVLEGGDYSTVIDSGAGGLRVAIPVALAGHKVNGIDISARMVEKGHERMTEFQQMAAQGKEDSYKQEIDQVMAAHNLSYGAEDIAALPNRINIQEGNFSTFDREHYEATFGGQADAAIMMWHTFGFAGDHAGQVKALTNLYDCLRADGLIIIEMPDRNFGQYARMIRKYHAEHPTEPFGAVVDAPSSQPGQVTEQDSANLSPRYFPSKEEIELAFKEAGFVVEDVQTYFVRNADNLVIKENMFVGRKPFDRTSAQKSGQSAEQLPTNNIPVEIKTEENSQIRKAA